MEEQSLCENVPKNPDIVVVMVPFPAQGHINQLIHLSRLINSYGIPVHFVGPTLHNRQAKLRLHGWDLERSGNIHFHDFQLPPFNSLPPNPNANFKFPQHLEPLFYASSSHLRQPVFQLLKELSSKFKRVVIIHDNLMAYAVQDLKLIPNAESYTFLSVSAFTIFFNKWESLTEKPFELDSDVPINIPSREGSFTAEFERFIINQHKLLEFESGRLFNSCKLIEGKYIDLLSKLPTNAKKKLFAIGPFNPVNAEAKSSAHRHTCLEWLDKQERNSVMYVSFGTITSMGDEQVRELAIGLQESGIKFIWVLRDSDKGDSFAEDEAKSPELPKGYEERVKKKGMIVRDWAPQLEILAHPATGGFMSHCGWNSCLESISMGVPIAAWPMHSDQPKNSILITQVLKIGLLVREWEHREHLITSATVENTVRRLMTSDEGEEMRKRAAELGGAVRESLADGGSSRVEMDSFIAHISR